MIALYHIIIPFLLLVAEQINAFAPLSNVAQKHSFQSFSLGYKTNHGIGGFHSRSLRLGLTPKSSSSTSNDGPYDVIIVGTGNGGCALLSECLKNAPDDYKILVLEQGQNFFFTSDITHENGWSKTYSSGNIFKLHNTMTPGGKNIISGRALTMGGGGR